MFGGAFLESKTIYCPKCGRKVATYDGRSTIDICTSCAKCKKLVVYRVETGKSELKPIPVRRTSSGKTFV